MTLKRTSNYIILKNLLIFCCSIILLLVLVDFNPNCFLADDTITQQEPVTNMMLERFFSTGKMPYIDFYAYKKANILSEGLYGLYNPFVLLSFLIAKFLFHMQVGTFSIYIFLMVAMGNCCLYMLFKSLGKHDITAILIILACMGASCYAYYSYYYFIYGCYFFIPLLCLVIYQTQPYRHLKYYGAGIVLAFSVLTGHMQYVVYFYAIYASIMLFLALRRSLKYLLQMIANIITGICMSCIHLYFTYTGTVNRGLIFGSDNQFLFRSVHPLSFFKNFAYPLWATKDAELYTGWWDVEYFYEITLTYVFLGILLPLFLIFLGKRTQESIHRCVQVSSQKHFVIIVTLLLASISFKYYYLDNVKALKILLLSIIPCLLICLWLFIPKETHTFIADYECAITIVCLCILIVSFGEDGGLAVVLSKLPIINSFRYLYKVTVLFIPLMAIPASSILDALINWMLLHKHTLCFIFLIGVISATNILGLCNNYYIYTSGINEYTNNTKYKYNDGINYYSEVKSRLKDLNIDTENYRILACLPGDTVTDFIEFASSESYVYMTKNLNTAYKCFTLMGYCNSISTESYEQSDAIMQDITLNGQFTNALWGANYFAYLNSLDTNNAEVQKFYKQMQENAVKYFICSKDDLSSIFEFSTLINKSDCMQIESITSFVDSAALISITGVNALVTDSANHSVSSSSEVDTLSISLKNSTDHLLVSMTYDPHYVAIYHAPDGTTKNLEITPTTGHYTNIYTSDCESGGYVSLSYKNIWCDLIMIMSVIISLCFTVLIFLIIRNSKGGFTYEKK